MDNNNFNELLLHTLKQLGIRLDRVDDRLDRVDDRLDRMDAKLDRKADKEDVKAIAAKLDQKADKEDLKRLEEKLDATNETVKSQGERLDRIEGGIKTVQWVLGVEIALVGIILAFLKAC